MNYIVGENGNQIQMIALEQLVAPDSWARVIDLFVDILPIDDLGFKHVKLQSEGRPPYNPVTLLKLYLYGYKHSIRSSRKLEHSCKVNVELWWLLGGLMPSFRTIAYFRKNNAEAFRKVFRQFVLMLKDMGLIEGETIGIDSFKIFAQNSLRNNYTPKKIARHPEYIDNRIKDFEAALDKTDKEKELLESKIKLQQDRRKKYETLDTELNNSNDTQVSLTDKDSRALMLTNNVSGVGYAVQAASDSKHKLLVHSHIGASTDKRENNNINVSIIDALIDYDTNYRSQEHGFELVVQKYNLNERDVYFLAFSIETFDYLIDSIPMETRSGKKLVSCATAVVGSVITTIGATTIATGWGLGLFLVGKAVSLVGVAMCTT